MFAASALATHSPYSPQTNSLPVAAVSASAVARATWTMRRTVLVTSQVATGMILAKFECKFVAIGPPLACHRAHLASWLALISAKSLSSRSLAASPRWASKFDHTLVASTVVLVSLPLSFIIEPLGKNSACNNLRPLELGKLVVLFARISARSHIQIRAHTDTNIHRHTPRGARPPVRCLSSPPPDNSCSSLAVHQTCQTC